MLKALAKFYSMFLNRTLDPRENVMVFIGATQALIVTVLTHTFPGDEWIVIEPNYDSYIPIIKAANGIVKTVSLKSVMKIICFLFFFFFLNIIFNRTKNMEEILRKTGLLTETRWPELSIIKLKRF